MTHEASISLFLDAIRAQVGMPGAVDAAPPSDPALVHGACEAFVAPLVYFQWCRAAGDETAARPGREREAVAPRRAPVRDYRWEALRALYYANAARKTALLRLLEEITDGFTARGIPFLLLKGAALEAALDLPPALRIMADLDLLVEPGSLPAAERALGACGLTPTRGELNAALMRERGYHLAPYANSQRVAVELHRAALPRTVPFCLPAADLWRASRSVRWRGRVLRVPAAEHLFVHTCIHYGYWHTRGAALRRVWDVALIGRYLSPDPALLGAAAARCGASRLVSSALWELQALRERAPSTWPELCRRLREADELWSPHTAAQVLRARARLLDRPGQRLTLLGRTLLPAREETANATGCHSAAAHLGHFLHPRRLLRGLGLSPRHPVTAGGYSVTSRRT